MPRPALPPSHSPTIAPTTASVAATRAPAKIPLRALGSLINNRDWMREVPIERPSSRRPRSASRTATRVAIAMGNRVMSAQIAIFAVAPGPNQRTRSGPSARIGVDCAATRYGLASRRAAPESPRPIPIKSPSSPPSSPPTVTSITVGRRCRIIVPSPHAWAKRAATSDGGGRMKEATPLSRTPTSHAPRKRSPSSAGWKRWRLRIDHPAQRSE